MIEDRCLSAAVESLKESIDLGVSLLHIPNADSITWGVAGKSSIDLFQSYGEGDEPVNILLWKDSFPILIKLMQEVLQNG